MHTPHRSSITAYSGAHYFQELSPAWYVMGDLQEDKLSCYHDYKACGNPGGVVQNSFGKRMAITIASKL